jgi:hypothetical protein
MTELSDTMNDQELKAKWVEALRSGEYRQTTGHLKTENGYCCLGVLADIVDSSAWHRRNGQWYWNTGECLLPYSTQDYLNIGDATDTLMDMNDSQDKSFDEIADYIEQNL